MALPSFSEWDIFQTVIVEMAEEVIRSAGGEESPTSDASGVSDSDAWSLLNSSAYHCSHSHLLRSLEVSHYSSSVLMSRPPSVLERLRTASLCLW